VRAKVGERVGPLLSADQTPVRLLGYGVFEGYHVPEAGAVGWMTEMAHEAGREVPRILLDNGTHVYSPQCWWGSEERVKASIGDREVVRVTLPPDEPAEPAS
jgi:hypothetical protein